MDQKPELSGSPNRFASAPNTKNVLKLLTRSGDVIDVVLMAPTNLVSHESSNLLI